MAGIFKEMFILNCDITQVIQPIQFIYGLAY